MSVFDRNIALSVTAISNLLPRFFFSCSGNEKATTYVRVFKANQTLWHLFSYIHVSPTSRLTSYGQSSWPSQVI